MSTEKKRTLVGSAALEYDATGKLEAAVFHPKIKVDFSDIEDQLGSCTNKTLDEVKKSAELLLATYFTKLNQIELRDIETQPLTLEIVAGEKYDNGLLKSVEIEFVCEL